MQISLSKSTLWMDYHENSKIAWYVWNKLLIRHKYMYVKKLFPDATISWNLKQLPKRFNTRESFWVKCVFYVVEVQYRLFCSLHFSGIKDFSISFIPKLFTSTRHSTFVLLSLALFHSTLLKLNLRNRAIHFHC